MRKFSPLFKNIGEKNFSFHGHALVTLYVQFLCSDWSKFDKWVHAEILCSTLKHVFLCQLVIFLTAFFHWIYEMKYSYAAIKSLVLFMAGFVNWVFFLRNASLVGNPILYGNVLVFHITWCVRGLKSPKRFWPYLIAFRSCLMNGKPE